MLFAFSYDIHPTIFFFCFKQAMVSFLKNNNFLGMDFTYHRIHQYVVYRSMGFRLYSHHYNQF